MRHKGSEHGPEQVRRAASQPIARNHATEHTWSVTKLILVQVGVVVTLLTPCSGRPGDAIVRTIPTSSLAVVKLDSSIWIKVDLRLWTVGGDTD